MTCIVPSKVPFIVCVTILTKRKSFTNQRHVVLSLYVATFAYVLVGTNYTILLIPPILVLVWLLQKFYLRTSQKMRILELEAKAPLFAQLSEMGTGVEHMRSFGVQEQMV